jgi:arylformamidase
MQSLSEIKNRKWVKLSYTLSPSTPVYGGGDSINIKKVRSLDQGDSCNALQLSFSNHLGSHVDSPKHFLIDGKTVDDYTVTDWIFIKPWLVDIKSEEGEIIGIDQIEKALNGCSDADLLLIRTGFYGRRSEMNYWASSPAFHPDLASYLKKKLPSLSAVGFDTISLTSYLHRDLGRLAHLTFLKMGLRLFEDLDLGHSIPGDAFELVIALPLIIENADGAPCTIIALPKELK